MWLLILAELSFIGASMWLFESGKVLATLCKDGHKVHFTARIIYDTTCLAFSQSKQITLLLCKQSLFQILLFQIVLFSIFLILLTFLVLRIFVKIDQTYQSVYFFHIQAIILDYLSELGQVALAQLWQKTVIIVIWRRGDNWGSHVFRMGLLRGLLNGGIRRRLLFLGRVGARVWAFLLG